MRSSLNHLRRQIVTATTVTKEGHIASALSILDLLWVLYDRVLRFDPKNPASPERDRFILSKGHGSLALYAVLAEKGFFPMTELAQFSTYQSRLGGHPDCNKVPGVEASTGSLGHGLPMAVGVAMGLRIRKIDRRVFVLVGDGECNEGSIWEAVLLAAHHRLSHLTCLVDYNHSTDRALGMGDIAAKFAAFGWAATTIDGHDAAAIEAALRQRDPQRPTAIVAETVKGRGCKQMENNPAWHHRAPSPEELECVLKELA
jgi:transketolase